eukprot:4693196-Pyramimonas_sp.AAC.2
MQQYEDVIRGANELRDLREELDRITAMVTNDTAAAATTSAGQPASSSSEAQATVTTAPAINTPMPL